MDHRWTATAGIAQGPALITQTEQAELIERIDAMDLLALRSRKGQAKGRRGVSAGAIISRWDRSGF